MKLASEYILEMRDISKKYGENAVLAGVSLKVNRADALQVGRIAGEIILKIQLIFPFLRNVWGNVGVLPQSPPLLIALWQIHPAAKRKKGV